MSRVRTSSPAPIPHLVLGECRPDDRGPRHRSVGRAEIAYSLSMPDAAAERAIRALIADTYAGMSSREPGTARFFAHPDIAIAGSGQGELVSGPAMAAL